jgi:transcriptional regulator with XRE-family HTH domain
MRRKNAEAYKPFESFEEFFIQAEQRPGHWIELAKLEFTNEVIGRMKGLGVSKSELAARLNVRPGFVTRLLSGENNFELATMVKLARALDCEYRSHLQPSGTKSCWINLLDSQAEPAVSASGDWREGQFETIAKFESQVLDNEPVTIAA